MSRMRLAICDGDQTYCHRLDEYLHSNLRLSFDIFSFTDLDILSDFAGEKEISLLIISESRFHELQNTAAIKLFRNIMILDEESCGAEMVCEASADNSIRTAHISKFQAASGLMAGIVDFCVESNESFEGLVTQTNPGGGSIIGLYSPISKCGQTTLGIQMARKLSEDKKVIFLSFESFSSLPQMLGVNPESDITDLLYYAECERSKLGLHLEKIKVTYGDADYIMPARCAFQIKDVEYDKTRELLEYLISEAGYDYVILDMTEYPGGFMDILSLCSKVFTIVGSGDADKFRQRLYEEVLIESGYGDIKTKTVKCSLPDMNDRSYETVLQGLLKKAGFSK